MQDMLANKNRSVGGLLSRRTHRSFWLHILKPSSSVVAHKNASHRTLSVCNTRISFVRRLFRLFSKLKSMLYLQGAKHPHFCACCKLQSEIMNEQIAEPHAYGQQRHCQALLHRSQRRWRNTFLLLPVRSHALPGAARGTAQIFPPMEQLLLYHHRSCFALPEQQPRSPILSRFAVVVPASLLLGRSGEHLESLNATGERRDASCTAAQTVRRMG